ncbi:hypothetical protein BH11BAC3_BH11BAC3_23590 [soil metagenome]
MCAAQKRRYMRKPTPAPNNTTFSGIYYTIKEVAAMFKITSRALKYWRDTNVIPFIKFPNGRIMFDKADIDLLVQNNRRLGEQVINAIASNGCGSMF